MALRASASTRNPIASIGVLLDPIVLSTPSVCGKESISAHLSDKRCTASPILDNFRVPGHSSRIVESAADSLLRNPDCQMYELSFYREQSRLRRMKAYTILVFKYLGEISCV
jgi:hypothetical protein